MSATQEKEKASLEYREALSNVQTAVKALLGDFNAGDTLADSLLSLLPAQVAVARDARKRLVALINSDPAHS